MIYAVEDHNPIRFYLPREIIDKLCTCFDVEMSMCPFYYVIVCLFDALLGSCVYPKDIRISRVENFVDETSCK